MFSVTERQVMFLKTLAGKSRHLDLNSLIIGLASVLILGTDANAKDFLSINFRKIATIEAKPGTAIDMLRNKISGNMRFMHGFVLNSAKGVGYSFGLGSNKDNTNLSLILTGYVKYQRAEENEKPEVITSFTKRLELKRKVYKGINANVSLGHASGLEFSLGLGIDLPD